MSLKSRTPLIEYAETYAIDLGGNSPPQERDRLTDHALVIAYDRTPDSKTPWRLRAIHFDKAKWTRSGIRRWWAAHEVRLVAAGKHDTLVPEICRAYEAPKPSLPAILLCHRNTPLLPIRQQLASMNPGGSLREAPPSGGSRRS